MPNKRISLTEDDIGFLVRLLMSKRQDTRLDIIHSSERGYTESHLQVLEETSVLCGTIMNKLMK